VREHYGRWVEAARKAARLAEQKTAADREKLQRQQEDARWEAARLLRLQQDQERRRRDREAQEEQERQLRQRKREEQERKREEQERERRDEERARHEAELRQRERARRQREEEEARARAWAATPKLWRCGGCGLKYPRGNSPAACARCGMSGNQQEVAV
jgi:rubrerythrin